MKKNLTIVTIFLLLGALLAACGDAGSAQMPAEDINLPQETIPIETNEEADVIEEETAAEDEQEAGGLDQTSSADAEQDSSGQQDVEPSESAVVSWEEALEILNSGDVKLVSQTHNLEVSLVLNDGRTIKTTAPQIDAIFEAIRECGEACSNVIQMSE